MILDQTAALTAHLSLLDRTAGCAADVEGAHGELSARLADGLGGNDADRLADVDHMATAQVTAIAHGANSAPGFAGQHRANFHLVNACSLDGIYPVFGDFFIHANDQLAAVRIKHVIAGHAAQNALADADDHLTAVQQRLGNRVAHGAAVLLNNGRILGHIHQTTGQITGVGGLQGCVGQALACAVRGDEILQHRQPFAEVGLDWGFDNRAGGLGHQAAHSGQLADLIF